MNRDDTSTLKGPAAKAFANDPFQPATLEVPSAEEIVRRFEVEPDEAERLRAQMAEQSVFLNSTYQVNVDLVHAEIGPMLHVSIKRRDKQPMHDWREMQRIKNAILGEEAEAVELYPAESRLVDSANQYHLWALPPGVRFPFGYLKCIRWFICIPPLAYVALVGVGAAGVACTDTADNMPFTNTSRFVLVPTTASAKAPCRSPQTVRSSQVLPAKIILPVILLTGSQPL